MPSGAPHTASRWRVGDRAKETAQPVAKRRLHRRTQPRAAETLRAGGASRALAPANSSMNEHASLLHLPP
eukprot:4816566-Karenia_brevis.AAC.1